MTDIQTLPALSSGAHSGPTDGMCIMEAVAFVAGEPWSDHPECACPVIGAFLRTWNDGLPDDERETLLKPLILRLVGTRNPALEQRRATMAADWLMREHTPAWLRLAGLTDHAAALASLPEITEFAQRQRLMPSLTAAKKDASAARAAAEDAARAAVRAAAWDALTPTRIALQKSALKLVERMIEAR